MTSTKQPTAIDLFCGCGGISVGLQNSGFNVLAGIDIEKKYIASFRQNFTKAKALTTDITTVSAEDFMSIVGIVPGELNLLVGGPPCQGFSKNVPRKNRYLEDPKNLLVKSFLDYCEKLKPEMVLMENVAEMKNGFEQKYSDEIISRLETAGYAVTAVVLNSADYGVPQKRRRAFFMGNRYGFKFTVPEPTHIAGTNHLLNTKKLNEHVNVWEAISDLPNLAHGESFEPNPYPTHAMTPYQKKIRGNATILRNHVARQLAKVQYERLASLKPGQGHKDLPEHLKTKGGYSGAYGRLTKDMIAPTITRWVFHPGSGRWGHPEDIRTLTIREVARIQSFPDSYEFVGSYNDQAGQLGNAVPPLLAEAIVKSMRTQLDAFKNSTKDAHGTLLMGNMNETA